MTISISNVHVTYGDVHALEGASAQIRAGAVTGLVGMNGAGKSTLFNAIMGAVSVSQGSVEIDGMDPKAARKQGLVGYVPQAESVDWNFPVSVRDVVMMGRYSHMGFRRRPKTADIAAVNAALARVEMTDLADRQIGQLSGGQRKRVFVARGIAQDAQILLLDEPFAGVDKRTEGVLSVLLKELAAEGRTVLVSTHDLAALPSLASEVVLLFKKVLAQGPPAEVLTTEMLARAFGFEVGELPSAMKASGGVASGGVSSGGEDAPDTGDTSGGVDTVGGADTHSGGDAS